MDPAGEAGRALKIMLPSLPYSLSISLHFASTFHFRGQYLLLTSNFCSLEFAVVLQRAQDTAVLGQPEG